MGTYTSARNLASEILIRDTETKSNAILSRAMIIAAGGDPKDLVMRRVTQHSTQKVTRLVYNTTWLALVTFVVKDGDIN